MPDGNDDLVRMLKQELSDAKVENKRLSAEAARRRAGKRTAVAEVQQKLDQALAENAQLIAQMDELATDVEAMAGEHDEALTTAQTRITELEESVKTAPGEAATRLAKLESEIALRDHKDVFKELAADPEVRLKKDVPIEELWRTIGYKPEGPADKATVKALLAKELESRDWFRDPASPDGPAPEPAPDGKPPKAAAKPPGPGIARGTTGGGDRGTKFVVPAGASAQWRYENDAEIMKAAAEGRLEYGKAE